MFKGKKGKVTRKKIFSYVIVFLLVGGLLLSVTVGFFDFLWGRKNLANSREEDEMLLSLQKQVGFLEESWREDPADLEKQVALGGAYYDLAMYCWGQGQKEGEKYAKKSQELLQSAVEGGLREPAAILQMALLAAFIAKDDLQAEKYFQETIKLQDDYPEAHFYYGLFLASCERVAEAQIHWESVLRQAEEDSPLAGAARGYLQVYAEKEGTKGEDQSEKIK